MRMTDRRQMRAFLTHPTDRPGLRAGPSAAGRLGIIDGAGREPSLAAVQPHRQQRQLRRFCVTTVWVWSALSAVVGSEVKSLRGLRMPSSHIVR
jgi:hypothetical protein